MSICLFYVLFALQTEGCKIYYTSKESWQSHRIDTVGVRSELQLYTIAQINRSYSEFGSIIEPLIQKVIDTDSILLVHKLSAHIDFKANFDKPFFVEKSLLIDISKTSVFSLTYSKDSARICKVKLDTRDLASFQRLKQLDGTVPPPSGFYHKTENYLLEFSGRMERKLFYVCIQGLPRQHFLTDNVLRPESEWAWLIEMLK
jgi:hypothetical protein